MEEIGPSTDMKDPLIQMQLRRRNNQKRRSNTKPDLDQDVKHNGNLRRKHDQVRFRIMFFLTGGFFAAELVTATMTGSLAMMSDAMHMLSDFFALLVGYYSLRFAKKSNNPAMTYGYSRAEVIGALLNSSGLLAICFTIFVEAFQRFFIMESMHVKNLRALLTVAVIGLIINLLGLIVFGHGHSHGAGHGHSHREHGHNHAHGKHRRNHSQSDSYLENDHNGDITLTSSDEAKAEKKVHSNLNVQGVWLHVLGDALGSIAVIISAIVMEFTTWNYRYYADPVCSIIITVIITYTTVPLLRKTVRVLMHATPHDLNLIAITEALFNLDKVLDVHDVHAWTLTPGTVIGTAHLIILPGSDHSNILDKAKEILHKKSIHSSVIQIEAANDDNWKDGHSSCYDLICEEELSNSVDLCCTPKDVDTESFMYRKLTAQNMNCEI